mmetsp:Transcript_28747/g.32871  ORF Transcript_28747/g.32871 Transcript_28747/m.32871 type:complete len:639 (-) Transcript_28747:61-1977(-)
MQRSITKNSPVRALALYNIRMQSFYNHKRGNTHTITLNEAQAFKKILDEVYPQSNHIFDNYQKDCMDGPYTEGSTHTFSDDMKKEMSTSSELFMDKDTADIPTEDDQIKVSASLGEIKPLYGDFDEEITSNIRAKDPSRRLKLSTYADQAVNTRYEEQPRATPSLEALDHYKKSQERDSTFLSGYNKRVQIQNPQLSYGQTRKHYNESKMIEFEETKEFFYGTITSSLMRKRIHLRSDRRYYTLLQAKPVGEEGPVPASKWVVLNNIPKDYFQDKEELKKRLQYQFRKFGNIKSVYVPWAFFQSGSFRARKSGDKIVDKVESKYQDLDLMKEENDKAMNELSFSDVGMENAGQHFSDSLMTDYGLESAQNFDPIEFFSSTMQYDSSGSHNSRLPYSKFEESLDDLDHEYDELNEDESMAFRSRYEEYEELSQRLQDGEMKDSERFQRALQNYARKMRNKGQIYRDYIYRNDDDSLVYVEFEDLESKELAVCPQLRVFGTLIHNHLVYTEDADRKTNLRVFLRRAGMTTKDYVDIINNLCRANHIDAKFFTAFSERALNSRLEPELENIILIKCNSFEETFRVFQALDRYNESTNGAFFYPEITIGKAQFFGGSNRYNFLRQEMDERDLLELPLQLKMK